MPKDSRTDRQNALPDPLASALASLGRAEIAAPTTAAAFPAVFRKSRLASCMDSSVLVVQASFGRSRCCSTASRRIVPGAVAPAVETPSTMHEGLEQIGQAARTPASGASAGI